MVPVSVAVNVGVVPATGFELASSRVTVTVEVAAPSAVTGDVPVMVELATVATSAWKVTVPSALIIGVAIAIMHALAQMLWVYRPAQ